MKLGILAITNGGRELARKIETGLPNARVIVSQNGIGAAFAEHWQELDGFVCIMATGIAVRAIAPLLSSKQADPCVVVLDEKGKHVISLLSGHLGGGNELAKEVADLTGGQAVITTASDTLNLPALDLWAREQHLVVEDAKALTRASAKLVNSGSIKVYTEVDVELPGAFTPVADPLLADVIISVKVFPQNAAAILRPKVLVIGAGCNRGTPADEFQEALSELFAQEGLSPLCIRNLASIDAKNDEEGLLAFAKENGWQIDFYTKDEINRMSNIEVSQAALRAVGAKGVAEPAALLSVQNNELLVRKRKWQNVTMAVARANFTLSAPGRAQKNI